jgi:hypothetical protein
VPELRELRTHRRVDVHDEDPGPRRLRLQGQRRARAHSRDDCMSCAALGAVQPAPSPLRGSGVRASPVHRQSQLSGGRSAGSAPLAT